MTELYFLVVSVLPLAVDFGAERPYEPIKIGLLMLTVAGFSAAVLVRLIRERARMRFCNLDRAVLVSFIVAALAATFSVAPALSFFGSHERGMGLLFALTLLGAYVVARTANLDSWKLFWKSSLVVAFFVSCYGIAQWLGTDIEPLKHAFPVYGTHGAERAFSTLGHPNFLGMYLSMILPFAFLVPKRYRVPLLVAIVSAVLLTYSRASWAAALIGTTTTIVLMHRGLWRRVLPVTLVGVCVVAIALVAMRPMMLASSNSFLFRLGTMTEWREGSARVRLEEWKFGIGKILERPVLGHGQETYQFASVMRKKVWSEAARGTPSPDPTIADRLHNIWLDTAWASGILGLLALLAVLSFVVMGLRTWLLRGDERAEAAAVSGSLVAWLIANQVGFDFSITALLFTLLIARIASAEADIIE